MRNLFLLMMLCCISITAKAQFPYGFEYGTTKDQVIDYLNSKKIPYEDFTQDGKGVIGAEISTFAGQSTCSFSEGKEISLVLFNFYKNQLETVLINFKYTPNTYYSLEEILSKKYRLLDKRRYSGFTKRGDEFEADGDTYIKLGYIRLCSMTKDNSVMLFVSEDEDENVLVISLRYADPELVKERRTKEAKEYESEV